MLAVKNQRYMTDGVSKSALNPQWLPIMPLITATKIVRDALLTILK